MNSHTYSEPYGSLKSVCHDTSNMENVNEEYSSADDIEKIAKHLEKNISFANFTMLVKEPVVKLHPYSHYLIAPIATSYQLSAIDSFLELKIKTFCYSR